MSVAATGSAASLERRDLVNVPSVFLAASLALSGGVDAVFAGQPLFSSVQDLDVPAGKGAREPALSAMPDGRVVLSWTEPAGQGFAVRVALATPMAGPRRAQSLNRQSCSSTGLTFLQPSRCLMGRWSRNG